MTYENDLSPSKLVLCQIIFSSYGERSSNCQALYNQLSSTELEQLENFQKALFNRIQNGWEPLATDILNYDQLSQTLHAFISQCISDLAEKVTNVHGFVSWMVQLGKWKQLTSTEDIQEDTQQLLLFVYSTVLSFNLLGLSEYEKLVECYQSYFISNQLDEVYLPVPFPAYNNHFSFRQRILWMQKVQSILFRSLGEFCLNGLRSY